MARRKNTKFIDPRYFMDEKMERLDEVEFDIDSFLDVAADPYVDAASKMKHMGAMTEYYKDLGLKLRRVAELAQEFKYKKYLTVGLSATSSSPFQERDAQQLKINRNTFPDWIGKMATIFLRASSPGAEQNVEKQFEFTKDPRWKHGSDIVSDNPNFAGEVEGPFALDPKESDRAALQEDADEVREVEQFFDFLKAIAKMLPDHRTRNKTGTDLAIRIVGSPEAANFSNTRDTFIKLLSVFEDALSRFAVASDRKKMMRGVVYSDDSYYANQGGPPRKQ